MNLSLIITIVLIAIVIPWLWRCLFPRTHRLDTPWLVSTSQQPFQSEHRHSTRPIRDHADLFMQDSLAVLPTSSMSPSKSAIKGQRDLLSPHQFYTVQVLAQDQQFFQGYELLQALQNAGLEYGPDDLFHFYADDESDEVLFSVASIIPPGTFDLQTIGAFTTPALALFIDTQCVPKPEEIYPLMLETAEQLAEDLGGAVHEKRG